MNKLDNTRRKTCIVLACTLLCCACIVIVFAWQAIWTNDDITYRFHFLTKNPITSVGEVISSQVTHYFTANGRFIAHVFAQISIALWGQPVFAIINGCVFASFIWLLWKTCKINGNYKYAIFTVLLAFLGLQTKYTPCFQINYIWMFSLVLGYLLLFSHFGNKQYSKLYSIVLIPFSIIAGWSNEALVVGMAVSLIVYVWQNRKGITFNQWMMFFSFGIGVALLCFSPATIKRTGGQVGSIDFLPPGIYSLIKLLYYSRVSYLLIIYACYLKFFRKISWKDLYKDGAFYIHAFIALFIFNLAIGVFGNRQLFGMELMSIILIITYWKKYTGNGKLFNYAIGILLIWAIYKVYFNYTFLQKQRNLYDLFYTEYTKSEDGTVYYDLSRNDVTFYETYPSDVFTHLVISSMNRYFHYLDPKPQKTFKILPTCCKDLYKYSENCYINNASGSWVVITKKQNGSISIAQTREVEFMSWTHNFVERRITAADLIYEDDSYCVYQIYDKMPFVTGTGVRFL